MSDLYLGLVVLGILVIVAVVTYNWWQEKAYRREAEARFSQLENDVLMDDVSPLSKRVMPAEFENNNNTSHNEATPFKATPKDDFEDIGIATPLKPTALADEQVQLDISNAVLSTNNAKVEHELDLDQAIVEEATHTLEIENIGEDIVDTNELAPLSMATSDMLNETPSTVSFVEMDVAPLDDEKQPVDLSNENNKDSFIIDTQTPKEMPLQITSFPKEIDTQIDFVAVLHLPKSVNISLLQDFIKGTHDLDKHQGVFAMLPSSAWLAVKANTSTYEETQKVVCSIQLADRAGYISKTTLTRFQYEVDKLGSKLAAHIEWLTVGDPWRIASELDQFCIDVDKLVGFHIIQGANGPFTGTKLRGLAEASGLKLESDGAFAMNDDAGQRLYCMVNKDGSPFVLDSLRASLVSGVSFQLDIPRVKNCIEVFNQMVLAAKQMESSLAAVLVDDHQKPVGEVQVEKVRQQLKLIHGKMLARGIEPGSETALRLFL